MVRDRVRIWIRERVSICIRVRDRVRIWIRV